MIKHIALFLLINLFGSGDSIPELPQNPYSTQLDSLSAPDQVQYIIDHYYEIYSKDLEVAVTLGAYASNLTKELKLTDLEGDAHLSYGIGSYLKGDYTTALQAFQHASDIFDSLQDQQGIARLCNEMAVFYRKQNDIDNMLLTLDRGEKAAKIANDQIALSTNYHHRGTIYSRQGDFDKALPFFEKVLNIRLELKDSVGLGYIYLDLAEYETNKGRMEEALAYIQKSSEIRKKMGDLQGVAINEVSVGETYFSNNQFAKAIPYFLRTLEMGKQIGYTDLVRYTYEKLQLSYKELGQFENAYLSMAQFQVYNDSIYNVEKSRAITEMQEKYESEKKEQQIAVQELQLAQKDAELERNRLFFGILALLIVGMILFGVMHRKRLILTREKLLEEEKARNRELEIRAALASQEQERSRVAKDLHDGFGQMISILNLNLKSLEKENTDRHHVFEQSAQVLEEMYQELKSICFNLMPQTLIKNGIASAISEFASRINQTGKVYIETSFFGMDERLTDVQEISLYRIIQEWVNNMLKYSNANIATIQITRDEQEITLTIEDNGNGFDLELLKSGKGNGWRNMNSRTNLMKGELDVDTTPGQRGTTLIVNVPVTAPSHNTPVMVEVSRL